MGAIPQELQYSARSQDGLGLPGGDIFLDLLSWVVVSLTLIVFHVKFIRPFRLT
jgi:hypothetical protein